MCWIRKPGRFSVTCLSFPVRKVYTSSGMTGNPRLGSQAGVLKQEKSGTHPGLNIMSMRYRSNDCATYSL